MAWTEEQKASLSKQRGTAASYIKDQGQRAKYLSEQGAVEAKHGGSAPDSEYERMSRNAQDTIASQGVKQEAHARSEVTGAPSYKHGTDRVPKTGHALLHKDEAVLNKSDADKYRSAKGNILAAAGDAMGGEKHHPKKIKEIRTRKGHSGGYIHEHHHTHPDEHPMEEHTSPDQDGMLAHMATNMGEAAPSGPPDAGQGAMPMDGAAAPAV